MTDLKQKIIAAVADDVEAIEKALAREPESPFRSGVPMWPGTFFLPGESDYGPF